MITFFYAIFLCSFCFYIQANPSKKPSIQKIFTQFYLQNGWKDAESASGTGSNLLQTNVIRKELPNLFTLLQVRTMLDAPCGDFYWMKEVKLSNVHYIGLDIVIPMIQRNNSHYRTNQREFMVGNIIKDTLPQVDLILCRDCFIHFSYQDIFVTLKNFKKSGSKYLLTTTYPKHDNVDIETGNWRAINLEKPPFNFPKPIVIINEQCTEKDGLYADKSLGLWRLDMFNI